MPLNQMKKNSKGYKLSQVKISNKMERKQIKSKAITEKTQLSKSQIVLSLSFGIVIPFVKFM